MKVAVTHSLNIWFVDVPVKAASPTVTKKASVRACKDAMIEDGYWKDCEMEDGDIENDSDFAFYPIEREDAKRLKRANSKIRYLTSEDEVWAAFELMKAILKEYKV